MKKQECPAYNKNTEIEKVEIGSAYGKPLYKETEIILSEYCTVFDTDNFDCSKCHIRKELVEKNAEN